jgi:hypothetical protein
VRDKQAAKSGLSDQLAVFEGAIDARTEELMNSYGLDLLGPPLS